MNCESCEVEISKKERDYSTKFYGKILCRECQENYGPLRKKHEKELNRSTPEAKKLYQTLIKMGIPAKLEKWDKHKHIDIAIPSAKVNIEVDGPPHSLKSKQALADLKRTFYSMKKGYYTIRSPNVLVKEGLYETAGYLKKLINSSLEQLEEEFEED